MARYRGSTCKQCRISGASLCGKPNCAFLKRSYAPGQHGQSRKKLSEYALQLREKQKIKWTYGLLEKQFYRVLEIATHKKGVTGTIFLQRLESRFDNVLFRSGLVITRRQGRQLIAHGHMLINGKKVDIPSYHMRPGDVITVRESSKELFKNFQQGRAPIVPAWLETDFENLAVRYAVVPGREDIDRTFNEQLVIEYYSR